MGLWIPATQSDDKRGQFNLNTSKQEIRTVFGILLKHCWCLSCSTVNQFQNSNAVCRHNPALWLISLQLNTWNSEIYSTLAQINWTRKLHNSLVRLQAMREQILSRAITDRIPIMSNKFSTIRKAIKNPRWILRAVMRYKYACTSGLTWLAKTRKEFEIRSYVFNGELIYSFSDQSHAHNIALHKTLVFNRRNIPIVRREQGDPVQRSLLERNSGWFFNQTDIRLVTLEE